MKPYTDSITRAQALTLKAIGWSNDKIEEVTGITARTLIDRAIQAGYVSQTPNGLPGRLESSHVANAPKSGRPRNQEGYQEEVLAKGGRSPQ
ncbi:hypothetical protein B0T26DRAFT_710631 [Lasiosphaeria miniovina]|uniref:Uncharacterized protein n=1 Tax=Lasiosphaeria miniovina TaxID=1954250 RepID=A0AA40E000_9PEZI|nr:uncharacterized protein B0T26DRAFT_710631 [Lasiosphaeria miniovina]KAK0717693.1 hypothetical protein B0T26DRAFT_710631 [Lasiosphaeria miniovina]